MKTPLLETLKDHGAIARRGRANESLLEVRCAAAHPDSGNFEWRVKNRVICRMDGNVLDHPGSPPATRRPRLTMCERGDPDIIRICCTLPVGARLLNKRQFLWFRTPHLALLDEPARSPEKKILWHLHVPATTFKWLSNNELSLSLDGAELRLKCSCTPLSSSIKKTGKALHICLEYPEQPLRHDLRVRA